MVLEKGSVLYRIFPYSTSLEQNVCFSIINDLIVKAIRHKMKNLFPCFEGFGTLKFYWISRQFEPHVGMGAHEVCKVTEIALLWF